MPGTYIGSTQKTLAEWTQFRFVPGGVTGRRRGTLGRQNKEGREVCVPGGGGYRRGRTRLDIKRKCELTHSHTDIVSGTCLTVTTHLL